AGRRLGPSLLPPALFRPPRAWRGLRRLEPHQVRRRDHADDAPAVYHGRARDLPLREHLRDLAQRRPRRHRDHVRRHAVPQPHHRSDLPGPPSRPRTPPAPPPPTAPPRRPRPLPPTGRSTCPTGHLLSPYNG